MGFIGKNTLLIVPGQGSFLFLAEILWNVEIVDDEPPDRELKSPANCGSCQRCLDSCPTGAFVSPYVLDARKCISYLTIEKRGALSIQERKWLGEWVFGCDVCQEVCPFNHVSIKRNGRARISPLRAEYGVGRVLSLQEVLKIRSHGEFVAQFGGTAVARAKREGLLRNAAVVAANTCAVPLLRDLIDVAQSDEAGVVRQHCLWAAVTLARLSGSKEVQTSLQLSEALSRDADEEVRLEATRVLSGET
jgi:epoxyqueuosine reductase